MNQWPSNVEFEQARNIVINLVLDQISNYDLTFNTTVERIHHLLIIVDLLDQYCDN